MAILMNAKYMRFARFQRERATESMRGVARSYGRARYFIEKARHSGSLARAT